MYTAYFGFSEKPFKLKPDGRSLFNSASGQKCYAELVRGLLEQQANMVFCGESGSGKTSLIDKCCTNFADVVRFVRITNAHLSVDDILDVLAQELGIGTRDRNLKRRHRRLRAGLAAEQQRGRGVVLVVEDAHAMSDEALNGLLDFAAEPLAGERVLHLLLVGLPELASRCQSFSPTVLVCTLEGLLGAEIEGFIRHQLKTAGYRGEPLFTTDAIRTVAAYAGGIPRRINALCDAALFAASLDERRTVTSQLVAEAVEHSFLKDSAPGVPLVVPPPVVMAEEPVPVDTPASTDDDKSRADLTTLAADMEQTLEKALAVATSSAGIVGGLAKPFTKRRAKRSVQAGTPAPAVEIVPTAPESIVAEPSPSPHAASNPDTVDYCYMAPRQGIFRQPWLMTGIAAALVLAVSLGGWQWHQQTREAVLATTSSGGTVPGSRPRVLADTILVADGRTRKQQVELPLSLNTPPPAAVSASIDGLPPVDPENPFTARPLQATHRFPDLQGVQADVH